MEKKIVIITDGKTTKATLYNGDKKTVATAECSPEDTFDFNIGAKLAFDRLLKATKKVTFEVGDYVKCVKACDDNRATVGKIGKVIYAAKNDVSVEFLEDINGHDGGVNKGKYGHCWNFYPQPEDYLEKSVKPSLIFNWDDFKAGKFHIQCKTEAEARSFLKMCKKQGIKWRSGDKVNSKTTYWEDEKENTAYGFYETADFIRIIYDVPSFAFGYGNATEAKEVGVKVLCYNEIWGDAE